LWAISPAFAGGWLPLLAKAGWIFGSGWSKLVSDDHDGYLGTAANTDRYRAFIAISPFGGMQAIFKP
jgi:hypothetical protein